MTQEIYGVLTGFSGDIEKDEDKQKVRDVLSKLSIIKGYPISMKVEWFADENECLEKQEPEEKEDGIDFSDPEEALKDIVGGLFKKSIEKKFQRNPEEPILRYILEVKNISMESVNDGKFEVPSDYKLMDRH